MTGDQDVLPDCIEPGRPAEDDPAVLTVAACQSCFEDGSWDTMLPGAPGPHDIDRTWATATIERDDQGEMHVTWEHTGLTRDEAETLI